MKYSMSAVIPTTQYGNIQPTIEVEAESFEEAEALLLPKIQDIWNKTCEPGKELTVRDAGDIVTCHFSGAKLFISSDHVYTDEHGVVYQSGSQYPKAFGYPFNKDAILPAYANKIGQPKELVASFWDSKGESSRLIGDAIHKALEVRGKFYELADAIKGEDTVDKKLGLHPLVKDVVDSFFATRTGERALYEVSVVSSELKRCGQIDRLVMLDDKTVILEDFKTNQDIEKQGSPKSLKDPFGQLPNCPLSEYFIQLNFYRSILENIGLTVKGMNIHVYDGQWRTVEVPYLDTP